MGGVEALYSIPNDQIEPVAVVGKRGRLLRKEYRFSPPNAEQYIIPANNIFHFSGIGYDGLRGYSPIQIHRELLGISVAADRYAKQFSMYLYR